MEKSNTGLAAELSRTQEELKNLKNKDNSAQIGLKNENINLKQKN